MTNSIPTLYDFLLRAEKMNKPQLFDAAAKSLIVELKQTYKQLICKGKFYILGDFGLNDVGFAEKKVVIDLSHSKEGEPVEDFGRMVALLLSGKESRFVFECVSKLATELAEVFHISVGDIIGEAYKALLKGKKPPQAIRLANSIVSKIVVCPDSFKGTMSSAEVCDIIAEEIGKKYGGMQIVKMPIADGGEGTLECFKRSVECESRYMEVTDAYTRPIKAEYLSLKGQNTVVIEIAKIVGLPMINPKNPIKTTTFGIGQIIAAEAKQNKIILALGGSGTNDGGAGIAAACGAKFFDNNGKEFVPVGGTLSNIASIDTTDMIKADVTCMCDVTNPLCGENGAARVYAPQKGASEDEVGLLDDGLRHFAAKIKACLNKDILSLAGGGAAGGIGAGAAAFFDAKLKSGIATVLDAANFDEVIKGAALVITGEGKLDKTSFSGKAIGGILERAKKARVSVMAICGRFGDFDEANCGLSAAFQTNDTFLPFLDIMSDCKGDLRRKVEQIASAEALF